MIDEEVFPKGGVSFFAYAQNILRKEKYYAIESKRTRKTNASYGRRTGEAEKRQRAKAE